VIEGARNIRAIKSHPVTKRESEEPRDDEEEKGVTGTVLLAIRKLMRTVGADLLQTREKQVTDQSFYNLRKLRGEMQPSIIVGIRSCVPLVQREQPVLTPRGGPTSMVDNGSG